MGMRPPSANDSTGGPESVDFGIAALDATLDEADLTFPASREELIDSIGEREIPYDPHGHTVAFETAIERLSMREFDSERELMDALHPVFEEYRTRTGPGLLGWLQRRLPF